MKVVFLDRDGVINKFPGHGAYVTRVNDFHFLPGSIEAIKILTENGYTIFVISNQAGVSKGIFSRAKLNQIDRYMLRHIKRSGGKIRKTFYSIYPSSANTDCRKPRIGSVLRALKLIGRTPKSVSCAYFVGDTETDMLTGKRARCKTIFVLSGKENRRSIRSWRTKPHIIARNLLDAAKIIIENEDSCYSRIRRGRSH